MRHVFRKFNIRMLAFAVVVAALLLSAPVAWATQASGSCGGSVNWALSGGVLTISGSGDMADYTEISPAPWNAYADSIRSVQVGSGVTSVGEFAFFSLEKLSAASLASTVTDVGAYAFYKCTALEMLDLGSGVQSIGESAFESCLSLMSLRLPSSLTTLRFHAFYRCESIVDVTVPASVTRMDSTVFAYCSSLRSAAILANLPQLPVWTFYGCSELRSVTLSPTITQLGVQAFEGCAYEPDPVYSTTSSGRVSHSSDYTEEKDGQTVTTQQQYVATENSAISSQTVQSGTASSTTIDAVVENDVGLQETGEAVSGAAGSAVQADIHLKGEPVISGEQLGLFAGQNVNVSIHTQQGATWHIKGEDLEDAELAESYQLSFSLTPLTEPTAEQIDAVGIGDAFQLVFHTPLDFKTEVELPLGAAFARSTASFFSPADKNSYQRMQDVLVDAQGAAHFYLGNVQAETVYLIGINVAPESAEAGGVSSAIIPDNMKAEYGAVEQLDEIEYVVTGVESSWGMNIRQVTWILIAVMLGCVVVVGIAVGVRTRFGKKKMKFYSAE